MTKISKKFNIILLVFAFVFVMFGVSSTFAWLKLTKENNPSLNLGGFTVTVSATNNQQDLNMNKGVYNLNGLSEVDSLTAADTLKDAYPDYVENKIYMENFTMKVTVKADIAGYMRIKLLDEWVVKRSYLNFDRVKIESVFRSGDEVFPFELAEGWIYDAASNYCYYTKLIDKNSVGQEIPFIVKGISYLPSTSSYFVETCEVTFGTSIQVVQANRFEEIWGIPAIPQPEKEPTEEGGKK